jgi:cellulose synthase/poly-beta-1,6-N-acetylglucosamine synthase-like glycosyltransferase
MLTIAFYLVSSFIGIYVNVWFMLLMVEKKSKILRVKKAKYFPTVSILIPAHNEERGIGETIKSVLGMGYPKGKMEVIAIDNGSTDRTSEEIKKFKEVKLLHEKQLGKSHALNKGLSVAKSDIIGVLDADTLVAKDCLDKSVGYFEEGDVGAVTNFIKVRSENGFLRKMQKIEYIYSEVTKKLISTLNSMYTIPGTLSLFRRSAIRSTGFSDDTLAEDMDIALSLMKNGYRIVNSVHSVAYTRIPGGIMELVKQRIRWYRGFIENTRKHSDMVFNRKFPHLRFILPIAFISTIIGFTILFMSVQDNLDSLQIAVKSMFYIPLSDQISMLLSSITKISSIIFEPYVLTSFIFIFFTSFILLTYTLRLFHEGDRKNLLLLPIFMCAYYFFVTLIWCLALLMELVGWRKKW